MLELTGAKVLVTGASGGIGRACVDRLASAGAEVVVHYNANTDAAQAAVKSVVAGGGKAHAVKADLSRPDDIVALADAVRASVGELNALVNCAGVNRPTPLGQTTGDAIDLLFAINARAPFLLVQSLLGLFRRNGRIILVTSAVTTKVRGDFSGYAASKAAVESLVPYFAASLGERGIAVNGLAPGTTRTPITAPFLATDDGVGMAVANQAFKRIAEPEDIAAAACFLVSPDARWMTGTVLHVDGGFRL